MLPILRTTVLLLIASSALAQNDAVALKNYETLSHTIGVQSLRAGSHDPSGTNDYFFTADMYSLINSPEERNLEFAARKKIHIELGTFAEMKVDSLRSWKADEKSGTGMELPVDGDAIRKLTAQTMQEFKILESEVAIMVEVKMFEKSKKYFFFGEDTLIAKTEYFPVSQSKTEKVAAADLILQDAKGTHVLISVTYKTLEKDDKKQAGK